MVSNASAIAAMKATLASAFRSRYQSSPTLNFKPREPVESVWLTSRHSVFARQGGGALPRPESSQPSPSESLLRGV